MVQSLSFNSHRNERPSHGVLLSDDQSEPKPTFLCAHAAYEISQVRPRENPTRTGEFRKQTKKNRKQTKPNAKNKSKDKKKTARDDVLTTVCPFPLFSPSSSSVFPNFSLFFCFASRGDRNEAEMSQEPRIPIESPKHVFLAVSRADFSRVNQS